MWSRLCTISNIYGFSRYFLATLIFYFSLKGCFGRRFSSSNIALEKKPATFGVDSPLRHNSRSINP